MSCTECGSIVGNQAVQKFQIRIVPLARKPVEKIQRRDPKVVVLTLCDLGRILWTLCGYIPDGKENRKVRQEGPDKGKRDAQRKITQKNLCETLTTVWLCGVLYLFLAVFNHATMLKNKKEPLRLSQRLMSLRLKRRMSARQSGILFYIRAGASGSGFTRIRGE